MIFIVLSIVFAFCIGVVGATYALMDNHRLKQITHDVDRMKVLHQVTAGTSLGGWGDFTNGIAALTKVAFPYTVPVTGGWFGALTSPMTVQMTGGIEFNMVTQNDKDIAGPNEVKVGTGVYAVVLRLRGGKKTDETFATNRSINIEMYMHTNAEKQTHTLRASGVYSFPLVPWAEDLQLWIEFPTQTPSITNISPPAPLNMFTPDTVNGVTISAH